MVCPFFPNLLLPLPLVTPTPVTLTMIIFPLPTQVLIITPFFLLYLKLTTLLCYVITYAKDCVNYCGACTVLLRVHTVLELALYLCTLVFRHKLLDTK